MGQRLADVTVRIATSGARLWGTMKNGLLSASFSYKCDKPMTMDRGSVPDLIDGGSPIARDLLHPRSPSRYY